MQQQVWCWGRDIEFPEGNLLMRFGFERHRDRTPVQRSSCYRLDRDELHVCLWGFGMFFGRRELGGLFLDRFDFRPRWAPIESLSLAIHAPEDLPVFARPRGRVQWKPARKLWRAALRWIADYESWIRTNVGVEYRSECVASWLKPFVRAEKMAAAWKFLSRRDWNCLNPVPMIELKRYTIVQRSA